jgi:hypothetical protein
LNLQCTAEPPELADEVRVGLPRGVETLMFSLLEKDPGKRPASARAVLDTLEPFRSAGEAAPRRRTTGALPKTDTERTSPPSATIPSREPEGGAPAPRLDTVALVEKNAKVKPTREVPTWAGVLGIVLVSVLSFAITYRMRLSSNERNAASPSATLETAVAPSSPR